MVLLVSRSEPDTLLKHTHCFVLLLLKQKYCFVSVLQYAMETVQSSQDATFVG